MLATGPKESPREGAVVTLEDFANIVEACVERVLTMVVKHPLGQYPTAAADDPGDAPLHLGQMLNQQTSMDGLVINALLAVLLDDVEIVLIELFDRAVPLSSLITGTVPMGAGEASMIAVRTSSRLTPPVERSITVSAPYFTASFSFLTSSAASEAFGEAPMFAFTLHLLAMPMAIGSRLA